MASKPIKSFRAGNVLVSVFREPRDGKNGKFYSYNSSIQNVYSVTNKDTGEIVTKYNSSFSITDVMNIMMLLPIVWNYIRQDKAKNKIDNNDEVAD